MGETKRKFLPLYSYYDRTGIQRHLEQMAAKGWLLEKLGVWCWRYRRIEPKQLHFSVTYFPKATPYTPLPAAGQDTFWDLCAEAGWTLAAESAQLQVFYHTEENATPIETDPEIEFQTIDRAMRKSTVSTYALLLILSIAQLGLQIWRLWEDPIDVLSSSLSLSSSFGYLPLLLVTAAELIRYFLWRRRAKAAAEARRPVPNMSSCKPLSILILVLAALELGWMLFGAMQSSRVMLVAIALMLVFLVVIIVLSNVARTAMRHLQVNAWVNRVVSIGMVLALYVAMMAGITALIFKADDILWLRDPSITERYEYRGMTWDVYGDNLPLTVQDLVETDYNQWSTQLTRESSPLMAHLTARQRPRMDALEQPDLEYEVVLVHRGSLYDLAKQQFVNWVERHNSELPPEYRDEYRPVDAALWGAQEAYQRFGAGEPSNQFLICWPDRMAEIRFHHEWEITPELAAAAAEKLLAIQ